MAILLRPHLDRPRAPERECPLGAEPEQGGHDEGQPGIDVGKRIQGEPPLHEGGIIALAEGRVTVSVFVGNQGKDQDWQGEDEISHCRHYT